jgi:hypothetical protein
MPLRGLLDLGGEFVTSWPVRGSMMARRLLRRGMGTGVVDIGAVRPIPGTKGLLL